MTGPTCAFCSRANHPPLGIYAVRLELRKRPRCFGYQRPLGSQAADAPSGASSVGHQSLASGVLWAALPSRSVRPVIPPPAAVDQWARPLPVWGPLTHAWFHPLCYPYGIACVSSPGLPTLHGAQQGDAELQRQGYPGDIVPRCVPCTSRVRDATTQSVPIPLRTFRIRGLTLPAL